MEKRCKIVKYTKADLSNKTPEELINLVLNLQETLEETRNSLEFQEQRARKLFWEKHGVELPEE